MDKGLATFIGAIIGAGIAIYVAHRNSKQQIELLKEQLNYQRELFEKQQEEKLKLLEIDYKRNFDNQKLKHLEEVYHLLSKIKSKCSSTTSYIATLSNDLESFNKLYIEEIVDYINRIQMSIGLYFPYLLEEINAIHAQANLFWGNQQQYMTKNINDESNQQTLSKVFEAINQISSLSTNLQNNLKKEFDIIKI